MQKKKKNGTDLKPNLIKTYGPSIKTGMKAPEGIGIVVDTADIQNWVTEGYKNTRKEKE